MVTIVEYLFFVYILYIVSSSIFITLQGTPEERLKILFDFYDFDRDGCISSLDILNLVQCLPESSPMFQEVKVVTDFFVSETITRGFDRRSGDFFTFEIFTLYINSRDYKQEFFKATGVSDESREHTFLFAALRNYLCEYQEHENYFLP